MSVFSDNITNNLSKTEMIRIWFLERIGEQIEVWKDNVRQAYLLVDEETNEPIQDCNDYESAVVAIDKYKLLYKSSELDK